MKNVQLQTKKKDCKLSNSAFFLDDVIF